MFITYLFLSALFDRKAQHRPRLLVDNNAYLHCHHARIARPLSSIFYARWFLFLYLFFLGQVRRCGNAIHTTVTPTTSRIPTTLYSSLRDPSNCIFTKSGLLVPFEVT
jgi:hypothetical protein